MAKAKYVYKFNDDYVFENIITFGIACSIENIFTPWVSACCESLNIDFLKETPYSAFYKVSKLLDMKEYEIFFGDELVNRDNDYCVIGIPLKLLPENHSIKRMKIEIMDDLQRVGMIDETVEDLKYINFNADVVFFSVEDSESEEPVNNIEQ